MILRYYTITITIRMKQIMLLLRVVNNFGWQDVRKVLTFDVKPIKKDCCISKLQNVSFWYDALFIRIGRVVTFFMNWEQRVENSNECYWTAMFCINQCEFALYVICFCNFYGFEIELLG